jgi:hypothetical protein
VISRESALADTGSEAAVKFVLLLACAAIAIAFAVRSTDIVDRGAKSPKASISNVNEILEKAAAGAPPDGRAAPDSRWVARMTAACEKRERLLAALPRPTTPDGITTRGERILAIHRTYDARVSSFRPPAAWAAEVREIHRFNASQLRILQRVVTAARSGNLARASRESFALRELAGRANAVFLRLRLAGCAFGASGMPL